MTKIEKTVLIVASVAMAISLSCFVYFIGGGILREIEFNPLWKLPLGAIGVIVFLLWFRAKTGIEVSVPVDVVVVIK